MMKSDRSPQNFVVIPSYDYARHLPQAVERVLVQTVTPHEMWVTDDGLAPGALLTLLETEKIG